MSPSSDSDARAGGVWRTVAPYLVLMAIGVPWYWRVLPLDGTTLWLGMPAWVTLAVFASAATSIYTAWLLRKPWPGEDQADRKEGGP